MVRTSLLILALLCVTVSTAGANLLVNGSFESGMPAGSITTVALNSTAITGWLVSQGDIDLVGTYWVSEERAHGIDLDGSKPGCLTQTIATVPGAVYNVTFYLAGNPCGSTTTKEMRVGAAGQHVDFSFSTVGHTTTSMGWTPKTWSFTAIATTTQLELCSLSASGTCGAGVDNIVVDGVTPTMAGSWGRLKIIYR